MIPINIVTVGGNHDVQRLLGSKPMFEDENLAKLIALLHDIGRFEQIRLYHTFSDKDSINHAEFGAKLLFEDGLIRKFVETDKYDKIIKNAISIPLFIVMVLL